MRCKFDLKGAYDDGAARRLREKEAIRASQEQMMQKSIAGRHTLKK